jgi:hypothetical protein
MDRGSISGSAQGQGLVERPWALPAVSWQPKSIRLIEQNPRNIVPLIGRGWVLGAETGLSPTCHAIKWPNFDVFTPFAWARRGGSLCQSSDSPVFLEARVFSLIEKSADVEESLIFLPLLTFLPFFLNLFVVANWFCVVARDRLETLIATHDFE